ncbi:MAG: rhodanese-like domain-containing protein, partial [Anaerolineae bacterium]|nr:rhodanese-like domain-containing protein [Caldilineales bacterium]MDW8269700.1 rhodanese-like domain-containing protein [Anaerolineae bacterium]
MTSVAPNLTKATEIDTETLYNLLQQPNDFLLLDVRNEDEFQLWRIEGPHTPATLHIPYFFFLEDEAEAVARVAAQAPAGRPVVVVCAKGGASDYVAERLREHGIPAANLMGGMVEWGDFYAVRPAVERPAYQVYQVDRVARGCVSWVFISRGEAAIV